MITTSSKQQELLGRQDCYMPQDKEPDLTYGEMFSGLAGSIKSIAKSKKKLVDNDTHASRFELCSNCEFLVKGRCKKCGCFMKLKTKFASMKCPLGKWEKK